MKILIISDAWHPQVNGVAKTYENLVRELTILGHSLKVISPEHFRLRVKLPFYPEIECPLFVSRPLKKEIENFAPDHVHIATEGTLGWATRKILLKKKKAFSTCYHTHFPDYLAIRIKRPFNWLKRPLNILLWSTLKRFHNTATTTFVASDTLATQLQKNGIKSNFKIMTRGINHDLFYLGEKNLFADLPRPIALYVGRVAVEKNIEAFLNAPWEGSKVIVGDGPALESLKQRFPKAHFLGAKRGKELGDCYRSADIFAFPSKTDTFGMVNIEAMACGLPIAAYPVLGPIDIVTKAELGALNPDLAIAMKNALSCAGNPEIRHNHAKNMYSWRSAATQFLSGLPNYG